MILETLIRATAIGILVGGIVALDTAQFTPELAASPAAAVLLAGPIVLVYVAASWAIALLLFGVAGTLSALGLAGERLLSPSVLWTLAVTACLHAALNEAARTQDLFETWKDPLRVVLWGAGVAVLGRGLLRPARRNTSWIRIERALASGVLVAGVGTVAYLGLPRDPASAPSSPVSAAPRFEPEPAQNRVRHEGRPRVLVLGLDGAAWDRIDRGIRSGALPTFARLVSGGVRAPLRTLVPTYSPSIWTTIVTGVPPVAHGIEEFYLLQLPRLGLGRLRLRRSADWLEEALDGLGELRRVPVTSSLRRRKAIWNLADDAGLRAGIVGLWATWPPERLAHGFVVSDHASLARRIEWLHRRKISSLAPLAPTTYPEALEKRLEPFQRTPDSVTREELAEFLPVDDATWEEFQRASHFSKSIAISAFRSTHLNDAFYLAAARTLWEEEQADLMVVYAKAIDELSHFFYEAGVPEAPVLGWSAQQITRFGRVVDRTYAWIDRQIAPLVEAVDRDPNTLLLLLSDHGWERETDGGYNHNEGPPGVLILYGAGVCRVGCPPLRDPSVHDIAPTVLERLGLPLSEELSGRPLVEAFESPHVIARVPRYGAPVHTPHALPSEIDPELNEKLDALGYLD